MNKAGKTFNVLELKLEAAQCFVSGKKFKEGSNLFKEIGLIKQAAEALFKGEIYKEAADLYL